MKIPQHLKHHPVIVLEDYHLIDGPNAGPETSTDAQGLSLGLAQWNDRKNIEISAKVWRYTGVKWSRQSEELPLHRVLDLAALICEAQKRHKNPDCITNCGAVDAFKLQNESVPVSLNHENPQFHDDLRLFEECMENDQEWIVPRLVRLAGILKEIGIEAP